jgi:phosphopantothenoylcysteine decarboxylase / phosphopantothenate---cysteine ligase
VNEFIPVETASEMHEAVMRHVADATTVVMTAAVADYHLAEPAEQKIKRKGAITLALEPTSDILAEIGRTKSPNQVLIGFAAETENVLSNARKKLESKNADAIVVNDVSQPRIGFSSDRNAGQIITASDVIEIPEMPKLEMAQRVLDVAVRIRQSRQTPAESVRR